MITVRVFYSFSNHFFKKGLTGLLEDIIQNENEMRFSITEIDDISIADIAFMHKQSGDNPASCKVKLSSNTSDNHLQMIVVIDYEKSATHCNLQSDDILPYKACMDSTRKIISSRVQELLELKRNNLAVRANSCTVCVPAELSKTEKEIVALITYGSTVKDIATFYRTCEKRVSFHKRSIIKKLKLKDKIEFNHYILKLRKQLNIKYH
jgi:DNA-binding CsgD family transcriptional regulator